MHLKTIVYSLAVIACAVTTAGAQFNSPVSGTTYTTDKVGIGTSTPAKPLHIISPQGLRLEGTAYGTNILDLVPGQTTLWDRLDIKSVNANRGSSLMLIPNGTATSTKFVMSNQSDLANFSSMYILTDGTGVWISPQNNGTPDNSIANLSLGGGTGGRNWTNVIIPNGNVGIGTSTPVARFDVGATTNNVLSSVLGRLSEGNTVGEGTYLGIRSLATQPANVSSFSLEHKFGGQINSAINFNRGSTYQGGFITIETNDGTEKMRIGADGKVGIGTTAPADALHVIGAISAKTSATATNNGITINAGSDIGSGLKTVNRLRYGGNDENAAYFTIQGPGETDMITINNGNVGIGITTPAAKFHVNGPANFNGSVTSTRSDISGGFLSLINTGKTATGTAKIWNIMNMTGSYGNSLQFWAYDNTGCSGGMCANRFTILDNGNVGIGTSDPGVYKLAVNGTAIFTKVIVKPYANWPDYVFDKDYKLPSLNEVESFIRQNKHLPDVPSAKDVAANGIDLGDNQVLLLKKVEELTLYLIEMKKENEALKKRVEMIENKN